MGRREKRCRGFCEQGIKSREKSFLAVAPLYSCSVAWHVNCRCLPSSLQSMRSATVALLTAARFRCTTSGVVLASAPWNQHHEPLVREDQKVAAGFFKFGHLEETDRL